MIWLLVCTLMDLNIPNRLQCKLLGRWLSLGQDWSPCLLIIRRIISVALVAFAQTKQIFEGTTNCSQCFVLRRLEKWCRREHSIHKLRNFGTLGMVNASYTKRQELSALMPSEPSTCYSRSPTGCKWKMRTFWQFLQLSKAFSKNNLKFHRTNLVLGQYPDDV